MGPSGLAGRPRPRRRLHPRRKCILLNSGILANHAREKEASGSHQEDPRDVLMKMWAPSGLFEGPRTPRRQPYPRKRCRLRTVRMALVGAPFEDGKNVTSAFTTKIRVSSSSSPTLEDPMECLLSKSKDPNVWGTRPRSPAADARSVPFDSLIRPMPVATTWSSLLIREKAERAEQVLGKLMGRLHERRQHSRRA
jgi:hypothetical protein